jgi:hypothetical protein
VSADVDHVVHAPGDPVITILVATAAVAGEIEAGEALEIGRVEAFVVTEDRARLPRPGLGDAQITTGGTLQFAALVFQEQRFA